MDQSAAGMGRQKHRSDMSFDYSSARKRPSYGLLCVSLAVDKVAISLYARVLYDHCGTPLYLMA